MSAGMEEGVLPESVAVKTKIYQIQGHVVLVFPNPVYCVTMSPRQAREVAAYILQTADAIDGGRADG